MHVFARVLRFRRPLLLLLLVLVLLRLRLRLLLALLLLLLFLPLLSLLLLLLLLPLLLLGSAPTAAAAITTAEARRASPLPVRLLLRATCCNSLATPSGAPGGVVCPPLRGIAQHLVRLTEGGELALGSGALLWRIFVWMQGERPTAEGAADLRRARRACHAQRCVRVSGGRAHCQRRER